jgi:ubiquinone biosynthesis protein COQ4
MANPWALRPREALAALKKLLADPEQTEHVFTIIRALSGKTLLRGFRRFRRTAVGERILAEKRNLIDTLSNREWLRSLPAGSLGAHYLHFVESENLTADGLVEASQTDDSAAYGGDENIRIYGERLRDQHDLWHVTTGYWRDVRGEVCLLALTVAQTMNPGLALITLAGMLKIARENKDWRIAKAVLNGFINGRRAAWLPATEWEVMLTRPLHEVRSMLKVRAPRVYPDISEAAPAFASFA